MSAPRRRGRDLAVLIGVAALACASSLPIERRDYVLAHPHGWVEVRIDDRSVPLFPETDDEEVTHWVEPPYCAVSVDIDDEEFVDHVQVFLRGERAPFRADSGIRFPVPVGRPMSRLRWDGCRVEGDAIASVAHELFIAVERDRVTEVLFDGAGLAASAPRADTVVTLDDVYQAITGDRKGAR